MSPNGGCWNIKILMSTKKRCHHVPSTQFSLTSTAAMPMPEPMHMLVTKIRLFVCLAIFKPVAICRAPAIQKEDKVNVIHHQTLKRGYSLIPRG